MSLAVQSCGEIDSESLDIYVDSKPFYFHSKNPTLGRMSDKPTQELVYQTRLYLNVLKAQYTNDDRVLLSCFLVRENLPESVDRKVQLIWFHDLANTEVLDYFDSTRDSLSSQDTEWGCYLASKTGGFHFPITTAGNANLRSKVKKLEGKTGYIDQRSDMCCFFAELLPFRQKPGKLIGISLNERNVNEAMIKVVSDGIEKSSVDGLTSSLSQELITRMFTYVRILPQ